MDSYEVSHDKHEQNTFTLFMNEWVVHNLFFTLVGYEYKKGIQSRIQKLWLYLSLFWGVLQLLTLPNIGVFGSMFTFFANIGTIIAFITASSSISGEIGGIADTLLSKSVRRWQYVLAKQISHILLGLTSYVGINGLILAILALMKVFGEDFLYGQLFLLIGLNALVLVVFTTFGVLLSALFSKTVFSILGSFILWFGLIFLFMILTQEFIYSPVRFNAQFLAIIEDTWDVKYWHLFTAYGAAPLLFIITSTLVLYKRDF